MVIGNFQVQHVLRSYSRQLSEGSRMSRSKPDKKTGQKDQVSISAESKKRLLADRITRELMAQFSGASELTDTARGILERLGTEYGHPLALSSDSDGNSLFSVLDEPEGREPRALPPDENERLKKRLFDITQSTVYNDLA
jgi:hypothetical protein